MQAKPRVLIVDDNVGLHKTLSFILERKGYDVVTAKNGPEAIERVTERPFDVIFMDVKMPLMDGLETYRRVKEITPDAVVIMMTAYAVEELVQKALEEGAFGVIQKPLDIERVVGLIEESGKAGRGGLILVVDDDPGTCVTLQNILARNGHIVGIASTGEEAVAMVREKTYDVLFIDMKLPTINGLEVYLRIKEVSPEVTAVLMTAYRQEMAQQVEQALDEGVYACLHKPLDMDKTLKLLEEILRRKLKVKTTRTGNT